MLKQDEIIEMAIKVGFTGTASEFYMKSLEHFAKLIDAKATAKEREACAKVCEKDDSMRWSGAADAIRARGQL